ncbi:MAG: lauroyl acyltransferase [Rhodospirillales bacterium]|nr:lauroyl acyltransferase [Rhodospirillales bacterium]
MASGRRTPLRRLLQDPLEALPVFLLLGLARVLPLDWASALGGWLVRKIGPRISGLQRRAERGLAVAFPEMEAAEKTEIVAQMYDNFGRLLFEYPHLPQITAPGSGLVEVIGDHILLDLVARKQPAILIGGHFGNFEIVPRYVAGRGHRLNIFARGPNNAILGSALKRWRGAARMFDGGFSSGMQAAHALRRGQYVAQLIDHRYDGGLAVPFFGEMAMTNPTMARTALHLKLPVVPCRTQRLAGARFRITVEEPLPLPDSDDRDADVVALTLAMTARIEAWVRDDPGQWFWLHRRWPKVLYR